jgi:hypothetical protein
MPNFELNGFEFYDAPKNGGTTVRMWLKYAEGGLPADFISDGYYTLAGLGAPRQWTDTVMGQQPFFSRGVAGNRRWCITRDPVDRFISAYTDSLGSWNKLPDLRFLHTRSRLPAICWANAPGLAGISLISTTSSALPRWSGCESFARMRCSRCRFRRFTGEISPALG